jgi:hypothetical protein
MGDLEEICGGWLVEMSGVGDWVGDIGRGGRWGNEMIEMSRGRRGVGKYLRVIERNRLDEEVREYEECLI